MIFNGVIALIMRFPLNSIALLANYVTMVEERPLMSAKYRLTVPVFHFWPKLTERGLSAIAELYCLLYARVLVIFYLRKATFTLTAAVVCTFMVVYVSLARDADCMRLLHLLAWRRMRSWAG